MNAGDLRAVCGALVIVAAGLGPTAPAVAQDDVGVVLDPAAVTGRDFAGIRLPLAPVKGPLAFAAQRAFTWTEDSESGPIQRMILSGDVRVTLGLYEFAAAEAAVYLQKIDDPAGANVFQVFVYFDRVGTPTADAAISVAADRLPVRAVIDATAGPTLRTDLAREGRPGLPIVAEGERALARSIRALYPEGRAFNDELARREDPSLRLRDELARVRREARASADEPIIPGMSRPFEPGSPRGPEGSEELRALVNRLPALDEERPIFARQGVITLAPGQITLVSGAEDNSVVLSEGIVVEYFDQRTARTLQMTAQRAVVFLPPGELTEMTRFEAQDVRGIYLEGDVVATDGRYTLRGPRVYYDVQANRALVLDAVFWTYDQARRLPLYLRAESIRQESDSQFTADKATMANTAFFEPDLSIGVSSLTIRRAPGRAVAGATGSTTGSGVGPAGSTEVDAKDITFRAGNLPFFYFPRYKGDPTDVPLKDLRVESSSESGVGIRTTWNLASLLGFEPTPGLDVDLLLDGYFQRGPAVGTRIQWGPDGPLGDGFGDLLAYTVIDDHGKDVLKPGTKRTWDGSTRGILAGSGIWNLDDDWRLVGEFTYIGDETFIDQFFEEDGETRREFTTRATLSKRDENTLLMLDTKTSLNDFIANEWLLQNQGYNVERLPELSYFRLADDLLTDYQPGLLSYSSEYRLGRLGLNFDKVRARERGFDNDTLAQRAFGINADGTIAERLRSEGYFEDTIYRMDTRHELASQLALGPVNITPFVVARGTFWDNDFARFSPEEEDNARLWGAVGTRFATTIQRVDNSVDSRVFDLHRMRHIIEPNATVWTAGTNADRVNLPEYDSNVEGIAEGSQARVAIDQTWQTQRGGPGRWHSVDVFRLDTGLTFASDDADRRGPTTRWVGYRPEYSYVGNAWDADGLWQVSDTYALTGSSVFDLDENEPQRSSAGVIIQHDPSYSSFFEIRHLNVQDSTLADAGAYYVMTSKYEIGGTVTYDLNEGGFQGFVVEVRRSFASALFGVNVSYNDITNETGLGFVFQPMGVRGEGRVSGLGATRDPRARRDRAGG